MISTEPPWYIMIGLLTLVAGALIALVIWTAVILILVSPLLLTEWVWTTYNARKLK